MDHFAHPVVSIIIIIIIIINSRYFDGKKY